MASAAPGGEGSGVTFATRSIEVVTLGECMASFVALERGPMAEATSYRRTTAGAEANVAVGLARLGRRVAYIARVGADGLGSAVVRELRGQGVDVDFVRTDPDAAQWCGRRSGARAALSCWYARREGARGRRHEVEVPGRQVSGKSRRH